MNDVVKPFSKISVDAYRNRFGTWKNALEKFVEVANSDAGADMDEAISEVQPLRTLVENTHKTKREINWRLRWKVLDRDNFRCVSCGLSPAIAPGTILHVDHIKSWSKGGETVLDNLQTLCAQCNLDKGNRE